MDYDWPGNVRELKNTLTRALTFCEGGILLAEDIQLGAATQAQSDAIPAGQSETAAAPAQESRKPQEDPCEQGFCATPTAEDPASAEGLPGKLINPATADIPVQAPVGESAPQPQNEAPAQLDTLLRGKDSADKLNRRVMEVWPTIAASGSISRQEYQALAGKNISMRTAQYDLQLLVQLGLVRKDGRGPAQRYIVIGQGR